MEPTCVSVFVWHVVPSRLRRQRPLSLFTQASQQRAFAFSGGNHRQSLRSRRDADPPPWLRLPYPSSTVTTGASTALVHTSVVAGQWVLWLILAPGLKGNTLGSIKCCSSPTGKLTQVEGIVNRDINSFQGHTCFWFTIVRTIRSQWRCFMRRTGPADSHEKSHFPWSAFSLTTFPSLLFHLFSFFSTTETKLTS